MNGRLGGESWGKRECVGGRERERIVDVVWVLEMLVMQYSVRNMTHLL
jgi:hypothetical protein